MSLQVLISLAFAVAAVSAQAANGLTVNTPQSVQACLPVQITWAGGTPPYFVALIPGGQPGGTMIKDFGQQTGNSITWNVDQPAGTSISVQIRDSTGVLNYSDKFNVQSSTTSCTGSSSSSSNSSSTAAPPKGGSAPSTSTPSTSTPSTPATTPAKGGSTNSSSTATAPSTTSGGSAAATSTPAPAAASSSDASRTIPALFAVVLSAGIAIFA